MTAQHGNWIWKQLRPAPNPLPSFPGRRRHHESCRTIRDTEVKEALGTCRGSWGSEAGVSLKKTRDGRFGRRRWSVRRAAAPPFLPPGCPAAKNINGSMPGKELGPFPEASINRCEACAPLLESFDAPNWSLPKASRPQRGGGGEQGDQ